MKKYFSGVLACIFCLCAAVTLGACGAKGDKGGEHTYYYDAETGNTKCVYHEEATLPLTFAFDAAKSIATVSGVAEGFDGVQIVIPSAVRDGKDGTTYPVERIGYRAIAECNTLTSVTFPARLKCIMAEAFDGCAALESLTFATDLQGNSALEEVESLAFARTGLTAVSLPGSVERIGHYAYLDCEELTTAVLPSGVKEIGNYAFSGCTALASVALPASVTEIGARVFEGCTALASVAFAEGIALSALKESTFSGCTALREITLPQQLKQMGSNVFAGCTTLASVMLPIGLENIGNAAFRGCTALETLFIPYGLTSLGGYAFDGCAALAEIRFDDEKRSWRNIVQDVVGWNGDGHSLTVRCLDGNLSYSGTALQQ